MNQSLTGCRLVITLLRVLFNREDADGYEMLFHEVYKVVSEVAGREMQFHYIHGRGIKSIVVDMDRGQMDGNSNCCPGCCRLLTSSRPVGLGRFLQMLDPQNRNPDENLQHIIIFCRVHFF